MRWTSCCRLLAALCACLLTLVAPSEGGPAGAEPPAFVMAWNPSGDQLAVTAPNAVIVYAYANFALTPMAVLPILAMPSALAWSPSGGRVAVGDGAGGLTVWEVASGRQMWAVAASPAPIRAVAWGDRIAITARAAESVRLFTPSGQPDGEIPLSGPIMSLAFGPDGRQLAIGGAVRGTYEQGYAEIWDSATCTRLYAYHAEMRPASRLAWLPRAPSQVAILTRYALFVWEPSTDATRPVDMRLAEGVEAAAFAWSEDGNLFGGAVNHDAGSLLFVRRGDREIGEFRPDGVTIREIGWGGHGAQAVIAVLDGGGALHLLDGESAIPRAAAILNRP